MSAATLQSTATRTVRIDAPVDRVWAIVSDPRRLAEFSPENTAAVVDGPLAVGSVFEGSNARDGNEWTTPCRVTALDANSRFAFHAGDDETGTTWSFELDEADSGTELRQSYDSLRLRHPDWVGMLTGRDLQLQEDMDQTLAGIKAAAES